jgi:predicted ATPase/class 3 adenylate cyclase
MKVAIALGSARRLQVGDPAIQFIDALGGATLDRMARGEHLAEPGEVLLPAAALAALAEGVETGRAVEGYVAVAGLQPRAPRRPWDELAAADLSEGQLRPWLLPSVFERVRGSQGQFLAEIRPAVMLFLRFGGLDYDDDPQAGVRLDAYLQRAQRILLQHEAYLLQLTIGDKGSYVYAAFGAPVAHTDDAQRAAAAALELLAASREFDFLRQVSLGLYQGRVWCGAYGGRTRHTYGVLGDTVNVAARLMSAAASGEVLAGGTLLEALGAAFDVEPAGELKLKGKAEPLPAVRLLRRRAPAGALAGPSSHPLVGRERELERLSGCLDAVLRGRGQLVRVNGVPGVGKSRLVAEFAPIAGRRGARLLTTVCQSIARSTPYAPWQPVLRQLLEVPADRPPEVQADAALQSLRQLNPAWTERAPLLGPLLGLPLSDNPTTAAFDPGLRQAAACGLTAEVVQTLAARQPLVLVIDEAHWLDEASQALLLRLGRSLSADPVLLLWMQRPPPSDEPDPLAGLEREAHFHGLELGELSSAGIAALLEARLGGPLASAALAVIQAQAQGNAFYAEELADSLRETGALARGPEQAWDLSAALAGTLRERGWLERGAEAGQWQLKPGARLAAAELGLPESIETAVLSRADRLPENHKLTLKVASVVGPLFELEVLARAHPGYPGREAFEAQLRDLEQRDFTRLEAPAPRSAYIFRSVITQEVVYATLLETQQRALHGRVASVLERLRPEEVEALAHHFQRAGQRGKTLAYLGRAAEKAQRAYANETALHYYTQALVLEERWEWRKGQAEVLHLLGRRAAEAEALRALEALAEAPPYETALLWSRYAEATGGYAEARAAAERALQAARDTFDQVSEAEAQNQLGVILFRQGDFSGAGERFRQARALFVDDRATGPAETRVLARALNGLGVIHRQLGQFEAAAECYRRAGEIYAQAGDRHGQAETLSNLGTIAHYQRRLAEAAAIWRQALEQQKQIGNLAGVGRVSMNLSQVLRDLGEYGSAQDLLQAALGIHRATGNRWEEVNACMDLGILRQELGDLAQAETSLQRALQISREMGDESGQAYVLANLGLAALEGGRLEAAAALLQEGWVLAHSQADVYLESAYASYLGQLYLRRGEVEQARRWAEAAEQQRLQSSMPLRALGDRATLALARLAAGDLAEAATAARSLLAALDECGGEGPEAPQRDYFACFQVLQAAGEAEAAQRALAAARRIVFERAGKITDPDLRRSFLENVPINRQITEAAGLSG